MQSPGTHSSASSSPTGCKRRSRRRLRGHLPPRLAVLTGSQSRFRGSEQAHGWGGRPQHAPRLRGFRHLSRCAPPACVFSGMNVPRGMRVVSINPPWVTSAASCRVQGPVINSQNYLYSHELLQYELQKKSRPVPRKKKKSVKICVELLLSQQILLFLASESTALHFRLCFLPFVREGRTQTQRVKMKQQNGACPQVKGGEMPAVEGGAASRAA